VVFYFPAKILELTKTAKPQVFKLEFGYATSETHSVQSSLAVLNSIALLLSLLLSLTLAALLAK